MAKRKTRQELSALAEMISQDMADTADQQKLCTQDAHAMAGLAAAQFIGYLVAEYSKEDYVNHNIDGIVEAFREALTNTAKNFKKIKKAGN